MPHELEKHDFAEQAGERLARTAAHAANVARAIAAAGPTFIADTFRTGGLFEKNAAVDHPQYNPMAAGSLEGSRRMCLDLIVKTIGIEEAIACLAERIVRDPFSPSRINTHPRPAKTENAA